MKIIENTSNNYREQILDALQNGDKYRLRALKKAKDAERLVFIDTFDELKKYEEKPSRNDDLIYSQIVMIS